MIEHEFELLRSLPSVHEMIVVLEKDSEFSSYMPNQRTNKTLTEAIRQTLQEIRESILKKLITDVNPEMIKKKVLERLRFPYTHLRRVVNATGVVLHTNCGRAVLAPEVAQFIADQASVYSNLELNIETGERGSRYEHVEELLCSLSGAEGAVVVNNNAAAVLLIMSTFAQGKEVVVSRGELVEVGGSFRIPEVLKAGGANLVEVGATNKTWVKDYERGITEQTALLLKVHTSNYRIEGFTHSVTAKELVELSLKYSIPVVEDLGSGSFVDGSEWGFPPEPTISQSVKAGISLVTFSGDKLLGGPQAGVIVGKKDFINSLKKNHLMRALRVDKLTLGALEKTLRIYERGDLKEIPVWRMLTENLENLKYKSQILCNQLQELPAFEVNLEENFSQVGGGAWPTVNIPTWVCTLKPNEGTVNELEEFLRLGKVSILARIQRNRILFDSRTLLPGDVEDIVERLKIWDSRI